MPKLPKTITILIIVLISFFIISALVRQILAALDAGNRFDLEVAEVSKLQEENKTLKNMLSEASQYDFIEEIARNKLNLSKPNETVVVVQKEAINELIRQNTKVEEIKLPNWQGWMKLFFR